MQKLLLTLSVILLAHLVTAQRQFWGTASAGGDYGNGFIFRTDSIGDSLKIVHHFKKEVDGENIGSLLLASNNKLYGLTASGGQGGGTNVFAGGTLFEYDLNTDQFSVIEHFGPLSTKAPSVIIPKGEGQRGLTEVSPGLIYGLSSQGSYVFSYNFNTGVFARPFVLPTFQGGATNGTLQNRLAEAFYKAADGNFYATTITNSSCPIPNPNMGTILRLVAPTNTLTVRHKASCQIENGFAYNGYFAERNGKLYTTTNFGGTFNQGVIYEYTPSSNTFIKLHDFHGGAASNSYYPTSLVLAKNGKLYGTTHGGGASETNLPSGGGTLYEFDLATNMFTTKYNFLLGVGWLGDVGSYPGALVSSTNGKLYGSTQFGIFEYNTTTSTLRMASRFWTLGFTPSLIEVCRKPSYQYQTVTTREVCADATFTLDLTSLNATTSTWKHNDVVDPSKTNPTLSFGSFSSDNEGTWVCTMTNECGSTTSQTITLTRNDPAQPAITTAQPLVFCSGGSVTLNAPEGFESYSWSTGETSREIIVSESGDYSVSVNNGCKSPVSEVVSVTVHELPSSPTGIEAPSYNQLKAIGSSDLYEWTLNDIVLEATTAEITVTETGVYKVRGLNSEGCRSGDFATLSFVVTAIEAEEGERISIYPNPASGVINVNVTEGLSGPVQLSLFNSRGQLQIRRSAQFDHGHNSIAIENLPAGLYHLQLRKGSRIVSGNVIVR